MRQISFRGMTTNLVKNEFVYGYYQKIIGCGPNDFGKECHLIVNENDESDYIDGNTVGQFTGLRNKNGVKIYEGDVVESKIISKGIVMYKDEFACFVVNELDIAGYEFDLLLVECMEDLKVVGNIHEVTP